MTAEDSYQPEGSEDVGAGARLLREVIRTPTFMSIIRTNMDALDPACAKAAVRTMMWEDPELSLSLLGLAPDVVNYVIEAVLEMGRQLDNLPGPLLDAFLEQVGQGIDRDKIRQIPAVFGPVVEKLDVQRRVALVLGAAVNSGARMVTGAAGRDPYFLRDILSEVDGHEVARAGLAVLKSACLWGYAAVKKVLNLAAGHAMRGDER